MNIFFKVHGMPAKTLLLQAPYVPYVCIYVYVSLEYIRTFEYKVYIVCVKILYIVWALNFIKLYIKKPAISTN